VDCASYVSPAPAGALVAEMAAHGALGRRIELLLVEAQIAWSAQHNMAHRGLHFFFSSHFDISSSSEFKKKRKEFDWEANDKDEKTKGP
jgi:hypothetical protein